MRGDLFGELRSHLYHMEYLNKRISVISRALYILLKRSSGLEGEALEEVQFEIAYGMSELQRATMHARKVKKEHQARMAALVSAAEA